MSDHPVTKWLRPAPRRSVRSSSSVGEWSLFFRDPDGMELEVCCSGG